LLILTTRTNRKSQLMYSTGFSLNFHFSPL
jgi:hypothetical protein